MSRHYFPSVLDDFEKQSVLSEESMFTNPNNVEAVTKTVQPTTDHHKYYLYKVLWLKLHGYTG